MKRIVLAVLIAFTSIGGVSCGGGGGGGGGGGPAPRGDRLARDHGEVVVGGLSAGGTMALDLALRRDPAALLLYAAVLSIAHRGAYLAPTSGA